MHLSKGEAVIEFSLRPSTWVSGAKSSDYNSRAIFNFHTIAILSVLALQEPIVTYLPIPGHNEKQRAKLEHNLALFQHDHPQRES